MQREGLISNGDMQTCHVQHRVVLPWVETYWAKARFVPIISQMIKHCECLSQLMHPVGRRARSALVFGRVALCTDITNLDQQKVYICSRSAISHSSDCDFPVLIGSPAADMYLVVAHAKVPSRIREHLHRPVCDAACGSSF